MLQTCEPLRDTFFFFFLSALLDIHIKGYILLYKQRKLQGIRPMGLAQTGQRDPCKAPPLKHIR
jgi:hypothetical protein